MPDNAPDVLDASQVAPDVITVPQRTASPKPESTASPAEQFQTATHTARLGGVLPQNQSTAQGVQQLYSKAKPVLDVLNRGHAALTAEYGIPTASPKEKLKATGNALLGGTRLGTAMGLRAETPREYEAAEQGIMRGLPDNFWTRLVVDGISDPLTYASGPASKLNELAEARTLPLIAQGIQKVGPETKMGKALSQAYDFINVDGKTKRALGLAFGNDWKKHYATLYGSRNYLNSVNSTVRGQFIKRFNDVTGHLTDPEFSAMTKAIYTNTVDQLPPELQKAAQSFKELTDTLAFVEGSPEFRKQLLQSGFKRPAWIKQAPDVFKGVAQKPQTVGEYIGEARVTHLNSEIEKAKAALGRAEPGSENYIKAQQQVADLEGELKSVANQGYVPASGFTFEKPAGATKFSMLKNDDPNFLHQGPIPLEAFDDAQSFRQAFANRVNNASGNYATGLAMDKLNPHLQADTRWGPIQQQTDEFFQQAIPAENPVLNMGKKLIDLQKGSIFFGPRHAFNIASLFGMADPAGLPYAVKQYIKMAGKTREQQLAEYAPELYRGAVQATREGGDRASTFSQTLHNIADALRGKPTSFVGMNFTLPAQLQSTLLAKPFELGGKFYDFMGNQLWTFDDAAKATYFRRQVARMSKPGMTPTQLDEVANSAALETNATLVDYNTRTQLADFLGNFQPFPVFGTKAPQAVGRSMLRHPGVASNLQRLSPAAMGGVQQSNTPGMGITSNLPQADLMKLIAPTPGVPYQNSLVKNGLQFEANRLGYPYAAAANTIFNPFLKADDQNLATYGQPTGKYLEQQVPFVSQAMQFSGHGLFPGSGLQNLIRSQTGFNEVPLSTNEGASFDNWTKYYAAQYGKTMDPQEALFQAQKHVRDHWKELKGRAPQ